MISDSALILKMAIDKRFFASLLCVGLALTVGFSLYRLVGPPTPEATNRSGTDPTPRATNSPLVYDPKTGYAWTYLIDDAREQFLAGDPGRAEEQLTLLLARMPSSEPRIEATKLLALILGMRREFAATDAYLTEAIELAAAIRPKNRSKGIQVGDLYHERAKFAFRAGKYRQSLVDCEAAKKEGAFTEYETDEYHELVAMNVVALQEWERAKRELDQMVDTEYAVTQVMLALVHRAQGRPDFAAASRQKAETLDSKSAAEWEQEWEKKFEAAVPAE